MMPHMQAEAWLAPLSIVPNEEQRQRPAEPINALRANNTRMALNSGGAQAWYPPSLAEVPLL